MAIAFVAMLGILWHVALLLINDGLHRRRYRAAVRAIANLPLDVQSVERDAVMRRHRWPLTPFGRAFSKSWKKRRPGRGKLGRAWVSNATVDAIGLACLISGCVLLVIMIVYAVAGTTPLWLHVVAIGGGTLGGLAGGAMCESGGMLLCAFGHLAGAAAAAALTGIAASNKRI